MRKPLFLLLCAGLFLLGYPAITSGQTSGQKLTKTILQEDAKFWNAYNRCDSDAFRAMFTDDVEFYHDKAGATLGLDNFMNALKTGLCGNLDSRLRREAVQPTVKVFPLTRSGEIYGAIISGEHLFYVRQKGRAEFLDGRTKFLQLWLSREGVWKMARILSYDHGPAMPPKVKRSATKTSGSR